MQRHRLYLLGLIGMTIALHLNGCGGNEELLRVDVRAVVPFERPTYQSGRIPRVAVKPLIDDRRREPRWHYHTQLGKPVPIAANGQLGELVSLALIDYLSRHEGWQAWIEKEEITPPIPPADYRLTGRILVWDVEAKSYLASTRVAITTHIELSLTGVADERTVHHTIHRSDTHWLMTFDTHHVEQALYDTLKQSLRTFIDRIDRDRIVSGCTKGPRKGRGEAEEWVSTADCL